MKRIFTVSLIASLFGLLTACGSNEATKSSKLANTSSTDTIDLNRVDAESVHTAKSVTETNNAIADCPTAAKIKAHLDDTTPQSFCVHRVANPAIGLANRKIITKFYQVAPNLEIAFSNTKKTYKAAQASCAKLGAGWHAPLSNSQYADPQATDNSNSLESVSEYLFELGDYDFWSSSASTRFGADKFAFETWLFSGDYRKPYNSLKEDKHGVFCVNP